MLPLAKPITMPEAETEISLEDRRLWIGNLDPRVTEFQLLKIIQKFGPIEKFDLLFHKSGPLAGQPRGYAFVTFSKKEDAESFKECLQGKQLGNKCIAVKWAHSMDKDKDLTKPKAVIPALGVKVDKKISSPALQIKAIEAKLKMMEQTSDDEFRITDKPTISQSSNPIAASSALQNKRPQNIDKRSSKRLIVSKQRILKK